MFLFEIVWWDEKQEGRMYFFNIPDQKVNKKKKFKENAILKKKYIYYNSKKIKFLIYINNRNVKYSKSVKLVVSFPTFF